MSKLKDKVLIVDDEPAARYGIRRALEKEGYSIIEADCINASDRRLDSETPSVVLLDVRLAQESGLEYLPEIVSRPNPPVVVIITAHGNEKTAVETMRRGAFDYLSKPFDVEELRIVVRNALEVYHLRNENQQLKSQLAESGAFGRLIGSSESMKKVYALIDKVAQSDASILIMGESGTGKELVAREIHTRSSRIGNFIALNCAAMPEELVESELFGHEKGAFTGAAGRRIGKVEAANRGTLFLDEVADMSLLAQAKLLRVLEERQIQRLGSNQVIDVDIRLISATNSKLSDLVESGSFREDLYYRLCVLGINLPPLRERRDDIPGLSQYFCDRYSSAYKGKLHKISEAAFQSLLEYNWPGNIRELRNCIERAVVLSDSEEITLNVIPEHISVKSLKINEKVVPVEDDSEGERILISSLKPYRDAKREFELKYIERCLIRTSGNITQAAAILGIHRQSLQHKIRELGLSKKFIPVE